MPTKQAIFSAFVMLAGVAGVGILVVCSVCGGINPRLVEYGLVGQPEREFADRFLGPKRNPSSFRTLAEVDSARTQSIFIANISAYCPCELCCEIYSDGITASGHVIQPGDKFVAAPPHIPFGTMLEIPGYGIVPVLDRGGAIKGNKLDIFFGGPEGHYRALQWGRKQLTVKGS